MDNLEPHQYQDIYAIEDSPLNDISRKTTGYLVYFAIGLAGLIVVLTFVISIPRELNITFVLKGGRKERILQYPQKIYIRDKFIKTGDTIHKGDSLFIITSPDIVDHIQRINNIKSELSFLENHEYEAYRQRNGLILKNIERLKGFIQLTLDEIRAAQQTHLTASQGLDRKIQLIKKQYSRDSTLFQTKFISQSALEATEAELQQALSEKTYATANYELQFINLRNNLQSFNIDKQNQEVAYQEAELNFNMKRKKLLADLSQENENLKLDYGETMIWKNGLVLAADQPGTVSLVTESESEINSEQILAKIETASVAYYAHLEVGPDQIGQIKKGQRAILKFASFPHYYYGTMKGEIANVSMSPNQEGHFPVHAKIIDMGKLSKSVTKGMTGTTTIILENKTIFDHLFRIFMEKTSFD